MKKPTSPLWFIADISHDLRAPLCSIISLAKIFKHHSASLQLPEKFQRFIKQVNSSGEFLLLLLNNILDCSASEMNSERVSPEEVDLKQCCATVANLVQSLADEKGVTVEFECRVDRKHLVIDRTRLSQILLNLLHNAIKFSPKEGTVSLDVILCDGVLKIEVRDQGPGIPADKLPHLFEMFAKTNQPSLSGSPTPSAME